jgi:Bacterial regulatory helix-turn-helix protein, lysR family
VSICVLCICIATVAAEGSFSRAAAKLNMTQPLSRQLQQLKGELGVQLLNRSRPITLTEPRRHLFEQARQILNRAEDAKATTSASDGKRHGAGGRNDGPVFASPRAMQAPFASTSSHLRFSHSPRRTPVSAMNRTADSPTELCIRRPFDPSWRPASPMSARASDIVRR